MSVEKLWMVALLRVKITNRESAKSVEADEKRHRGMRAENYRKLDRQWTIEWTPYVKDGVENTWHDHVRHVAVR